jgi:hypothetical protein
MNTAVFLAVSAVVALLSLLLLWLVRSPQRDFSGMATDKLAALEQTGRRHATYFGVIRQAMSPTEFEFLSERGPARLVRRAHKERRRIALLYLLELREDFSRLLRLARIICVLSPEVRAAHEFERLRLTLRFSWRYRFLLIALRSGFLPLPQLSSLSLIMSGLAARMDTLLQEVGESAYAAAETASSLDGRRVDLT